MDIPLTEVFLGPGQEAKITEIKFVGGSIDMEHYPIVLQNGEGLLLEYRGGKLVLSRATER